MMDNLNHPPPGVLVPQPLYGDAFEPADGETPGLTEKLEHPLHAQARQLAEHGRDRTWECWRASVWTAGYRTSRH